MKDEREHKVCPNIGAPLLYSDNVAPKSRHIIKARCKLWSCPYCAQVNKHQHYIRILNGCNQLLNQGQILNFVTITSHEKLKTTEQCLYVWRKAWRSLRERLRRKLKSDTNDRLCFFLVTELHKDKRMHWHGVINGDIPNRWFRNNSRSCGLGYQCKSSKINNAVQGANYALKYISKSLLLEDYPKKMRRITYSQSFPDKPALNTNLHWQVLDAKTSIVDVIEQAWRIDYDTFLFGDEIVEIIDER